MKRIIVMLLVACSLGGCSVNEFFGSPVPSDLSYPELNYALVQAYPLSLAYFETIRRRIGESSVNHCFIEDRGKIFIRFRLHADGKISRLRYDPERTTGSKRLIRQAMIAVKKAGPFPPMPDRLKEKSDCYEFNMVIAFD